MRLVVTPSDSGATNSARQIYVRLGSGSADPRGQLRKTHERFQRPRRRAAPPMPWGGPVDDRGQFRMMQVQFGGNLGNVPFKLRTRFPHVQDKRNCTQTVPKLHTEVPLSADRVQCGYDFTQTTPPEQCILGELTLKLPSHCTLGSLPCKVGASWVYFH